MIVDKKYTSKACSECLMTAIKINSGTSIKSWSDLGGIGPLCEPCLKAIQAELNSSQKEKSDIKVKQLD
jgi:hypothetical protein